jgi:hypothetical protein
MIHPKELAIKIQEILNSSSIEMKRSAARKNWEKEYYANENYNRFSTFLKNIIC